MLLKQIYAQAWLKIGTFLTNFTKKIYKTYFCELHFLTQSFVTFLTQQCLKGSFLSVARTRTFGVSGAN